MMIEKTMLIVILMVVTAALTQLITSFVVNVGAMLTIPHMLQVKIRGQCQFMRISFVN